MKYADKVSGQSGRTPPLYRGVRCPECPPKTRRRINSRKRPSGEAFCSVLKLPVILTTRGARPQPAKG